MPKFGPSKRYRAKKFACLGKGYAGAYVKINKDGTRRAPTCFKYGNRKKNPGMILYKSAGGAYFYRKGSNSKGWRKVYVTRQVKKNGFIKKRSKRNGLADLAAN